MSDEALLQPLTYGILAEHQPCFLRNPLTHQRDGLIEILEIGERSAAYGRERGITVRAITFIRDSWQESILELHLRAPWAPAYLRSQPPTVIVLHPAGAVFTVAESYLERPAWL